MSENGSAVPIASAGRARSAGVVAIVAAVGVVALAALLGARLTQDGLGGQHWWLLAFAVVGVVDAAAGATLVTRLSHRRLAWCLVIGGLAAVIAVALATSPATYATLRTAPSWRELRETESWAKPLASGILVALVPWELALSGRRRSLEVMWWTTAALVAATVVGHVAGSRSPGIDVVDVATWLVAASAVTATALLVSNWWRSRGDPDDALHGWLAAGAVVACLAVVPERIGIDGWDVPGTTVVGPLLLIATVPLLVVGVLVRAMRERPGRFQGLAHDVIGWLVLSGAIIVVYTVVVAGLGRLVGGSGPTWLLVATTGLVAVSVEPARRRIRTAVDRLVWGARDDPLELVRDVIDRVGAGAEGELLPALATTLRSELRLGWVAIDVHTPGGWARAATSGEATAFERIVALEQRGEVVGRLIVGWEDGPHLRARDERVLTELAGPLALAVAWVRVTSELRRSTVTIAATREEERRRLRRDLHDGLGPALTGVSLGLRTAMRQFERGDPSTTETTHALLARTADEVDAAIVEVKRISRDLRPTALDALGLVDAIAAFAGSLGDDVEFHLELPERTVELPTATEVAIYRIVTEALTNVVRHARATRCWVTMSVGSSVDISVLDDGVGITDSGSSGVGWSAMRERAAELGGRCEIGARSPHGTMVHVRLPAASP